MIHRDRLLLQRYDDPVEAEVAMQFLREHGVEAEVLGAGSSALLLGNRTGLADARLYVHPWDAERAREVLSALAPAAASASADDDDRADDSLDESVRTPPAPSALAPYRQSPEALRVLPFTARKRLVAFVLGALVPIGGAHFYARHTAAGVVFGAAIVTSFAVGVLVPVPFLSLAALFIVGADAVLGTLAVARYNDGRVATSSRQAGFAAVAVALSMLAAYVLVGRGRHESRGCAVTAGA